MGVPAYEILVGTYLGLPKIIFVRHSLASGVPMFPAENWNLFLRPLNILVKGLRRVMIYSTSFW